MQYITKRDFFDLITMHINNGSCLSVLSKDNYDFIIRKFEEFRRVPESSFKFCELDIIGKIFKNLITPVNVEVESCSWKRIESGKWVEDKGCHRKKEALYSFTHSDRRSSELTIFNLLARMSYKISNISSFREARVIILGYTHKNPVHDMVRNTFYNTIAQLHTENKNILLVEYSDSNQFVNYHSLFKVSSLYLQHPHSFRILGWDNKKLHNLSVKLYDEVNFSKSTEVSPKKQLYNECMIKRNISLITTIKENQKKYPGCTIFVDCGGYHLINKEFNLSDYLGDIPHIGFRLRAPGDNVKKGLFARKLKCF